MKHHALRLGWPEALIDIVELDTGNSAKTTDGRTGYKKLLSELALGRSASFSATRAPAYPAMVVIGIRCSTCVLKSLCPLAIATASMILLLPMGDSCSE